MHVWVAWGVVPVPDDNASICTPQYAVVKGGHQSRVGAAFLVVRGAPQRVDALAFSSSNGIRGQDFETLRVLAAATKHTSRLHIGSETW